MGVFIWLYQALRFSTSLKNWAQKKKMWMRVYNSHPGIPKVYRKPKTEHQNGGKRELWWEWGWATESP
jgi:hypothetical protein